MVKPSLDIGLNAPNITAFKNKMNEASNHVGSIARAIAKQFLDTNSAIKDGLLASASSMALGVVGRIAVVVGAFKLMGDAVAAVRGQIQEMTDIGDKAQASGFSPEFWQSWTAGAKGAEKEVTSFEGALTNAFQALKPVLNPDWSSFDEGVTKITRVETAMREMREMFTTDQDYSGFQQFLSAQTQGQKVEAVLVYMKQLQAIGRDTAALDLADKLFGSGFADKIRTNQISIDQLLENIRTKSPDAFSNEIVLRAKELDTQLQNAWHTIDQNLHPSMETLDGIGLGLKATWVEIVGLMAKASELLNPTITGSDSIAVRLAATGEPGFQTTEAIEQGAATPAPTRVIIDGGSQETVPLPRRRPGDAPAQPKATAAGVDRFETSAESIERRVAALKAEAGTLDLSTGARDKSRIAAQLETVAMQANAAAGLGANIVTETQRKRIAEVAEAYGNAAQAMEKAKVASDIDFGRKTAFLSPEDVSVAQQLKGIYGNDVPTALASTEAAALRANEAMRSISTTMSSTLTTGLADILDGTKSVSQGFADMGKAILRALEEAAIKAMVVGPIMRALGGGLGFADGGMITVGNQSFPKFADGGAISGPGGPRSDSILIRASDGEFMVNAAATARHRNLLEAINSGRLPAYADGGMIGSAPSPAGGMNIGGTTVSVGDIHIAGNPGTPAQNQDLVDRMLKGMSDTIDQRITKNMRQQMRPGGLLR